MFFYSNVLLLNHFYSCYYITFLAAFVFEYFYGSNKTGKHV